MIIYITPMKDGRVLLSSASGSYEIDTDQSGVFSAMARMAEHFDYECEFLFWRRYNGR